MSIGLQEGTDLSVVREVSSQTPANIAICELFELRNWIFRYSPDSRLIDTYMTRACDQYNNEREFLRELDASQVKLPDDVLTIDAVEITDYQGVYVTATVAGHQHALLFPSAPEVAVPKSLKREFYYVVSLVKLVKVWKIVGLSEVELGPDARARLLAKGLA